jgi:hypothetical protein
MLLFCVLGCFWVSIGHVCVCVGSLGGSDCDVWVALISELWGLLVGYCECGLGAGVRSTWGERCIYGCELSG